MNLDDLSASDLAAIDMICLEFEQCFESPKPLSVEQSVKLFLDQQKRTPSRQLVEVLRQELLAIESELKGRRQAKEPVLSTIPTPFQSKPGAMDWGVEDLPYPPEAADEQPQSESAVTQWADDAWGAAEEVTHSDEVEHADSVAAVEQAAGNNEIAKSEQSEHPEATFQPEVHAQSVDADPFDGSDHAAELVESVEPASVEPASVGGDESDVTSSGVQQQAVGRELTDQAIGPYTIGRVLARGGMGVVYRAFDTRLDRPVAIKTLGFANLSPSDPKRAELVERFEREAKAVAALSHPNIVELFDVGVVDTMPYAVMEFLNGVTLADRLASGPMSADQTRQIGMQIAGALATAHSAGVIHRDLKPHNVMVVDSRESGEGVGPRVKLIDFGLSRVEDSTDGRRGSEGNQTRLGMILGTPGYMSPEQARGEAATSAADMFGLGCVLYEVFYGRQAIPGETPADRLAETLTGVVRFDEAQCATSRLLCALIRECLNKDPSARPTATDVYGRLRQSDLVTARRLSEQRHADVDSDLAPDGLMRRHVLTTLAGGFMGAMVGGFSIADSRESLVSVQSIAVLTLTDRNSGQELNGRNGMPLDDRQIADGEILASALVNELSAVDGLAVLPYRPQIADTREQYVKLGEELGVDALVTGSFESQTRGQQDVWVVNWQLVSASDGSLLGGKQFVTEYSGNANGDQFLAQSAVASDIAQQIGRVLVTTGEKRQRPDPMAYGCMMKGHAYADADSTTGLRQALLCYRHAHQEDPHLSEPLAAMAVASLNLAARSDTSEESLAHLEKARSSMSQALEMDPNSMLAKLAEAMLEWQSLSHFDEASQLFADLHRKYKFNWQIQYQRGLFLAAIGQEAEAKDALRTASKLNPMSILVKTDRCRVDWYFGWGSAAERDALRYRSALAEDHPARKLVIGFLVDFYEDQGDFAKASEQLGMDIVPGSSEEYFQYRRSTLVDTPYGPFGNALNRAILDLRTRSEADTEMLGVLDESGATMFPLLLARHPAFFDLRSSQAAAAYVPSLSRS
ncbi:MAG: protein kinase [Planctomycetales bacterium]|nr:protein kinase [Planctomycetales bacterium]